MHNNNLIFSFRYKVYLEPEEDEQANKYPVICDNVQSKPAPNTRVPLQEKPVDSLVCNSVAINKMSTNPTTISKLSDNLGDNNAKKKSRRSHGAALSSDNGKRVMRMGARLSLSALHRERLRLTSEVGALLPTISIPQSSSNAFSMKPRSDFEDITMETKSLFDREDIKSKCIAASKATAYVVHTSVNDSQLDIDSAEALPYQSEEIDESLNERFNAMETDLPERKIVAVTLSKDENGRLGLKITGTPDGIYVEDFDTQSVHGAGDHGERRKLKNGDRILAINGRDLTNVSYANALDLIRRSKKEVDFVVSQLSSL